MELRTPPNQNAPTTKLPLGPLVGIQAVTLIVMAGLFFFSQSQPDSENESSQVTRTVASKLKAAGALEASAQLYAEYLESNPTASSRHQIAYSLATTYLDLGNNAAALRWLYEAEETSDPTLQADVAQKLVQVLEKMGRVHAARAVLSGSTQLESDSTKRSKEDKALAKVGGTTVYQSDLDRMLDEMPPELSKQLAGQENQPKLLQQFLADELLWRKAQKLGYDEKPEIEAQLARMLKRLVVARFLEEEVLGPIQIDPADLQTFFQANQSRYQQGDTPPKFSEVSARVEQDYRAMKVQSAYARVVSDEMAGGDVQIFQDVATP